METHRSNLISSFAIICSILAIPLGADRAELNLPDKVERTAFLTVQRQVEAEGGNWDGKLTILQAALGKYRNTSLDAALQLEIARCEYHLGKKNEAEGRLSKLGEDTHSVDFYDNPFRDFGWVEKADAPLVSSMADYFDKSPNLAGDSALDLLTTYQARDENYADAWKTAERLYARHPGGDRVKEDQAFLTQVRQKYDAFPAHFPDLEMDTKSKECFLKMRRTHMASLLYQANWIDYPELRKKAGVVDADLALSVDRLLKEYAFLLSDKEVNDYAKEGLDLLSHCTAATWKGPLSIEETINEIKKIRDARKPV